VVRLRVGLTGGIGAGKTSVARAFAALGAIVIDADAAARAVVEPGTPAFAAVAERWPETIRNGALDRGQLAGIVFADAGEREALEAIVHPAVRALAIVLERAAPADAVVVHDVPLLFESGFARQCDATVVVVADEKLRLERTAERTGLEPPEIRRRMRAQIDPERAMELADYTILNDGTIAELETGVREVWDDLAERAATRSLAPAAERKGARLQQGDAAG